MDPRARAPAHPGDRPGREATQPHAGRSACAAEARREEAARLLAMSTRERVLLALDLGQRYARLAAASRSAP